MKGRASKVLDALHAQIEDDEGTSLQSILDSAGITREVFRNSAHFKDVRQAWDTLKTRRAEAQERRRERDASLNYDYESDGDV